MQIATIGKLPEIFKVWEKDYDLIVPVEEDNSIEFVEWAENKNVALEGISKVPPKKLFFPQTETLYKYKTEGKSTKVLDVNKDIKKRIVFGVRPCDLKSLEMLDDVFLTKTYIDPYYKAKRDNTIVIALLCHEAADTCFCTSFAVDPGEAPGADLVSFKVGEKIAFKAQTPKGEELLKATGNLLEAGELEFTKADNFKINVNIEGLAEKLKDYFEDPYWEEASRKCIQCRTCTYLCPTCHCFDISSNTKGDCGTKTRCWDSCLFHEYTLMAGGHNPRPGKKERFRQRYLHKLQYFPERYEKTGCVGCGRCLAYCPVNIDISRIADELKEVTGIV